MENAKPANTAKKELMHRLGRYRSSLKKQEQLYRMVQLLESRATGTGHALSGIRHGSGGEGSALERAVERLTEARAALGAECRLGRRYEQELCATLATVEDSTVRLILTYRYREGESWERIAELMGYDKSWVQHLCDKTLCRLAAAPAPQRGRPVKVRR